MSTKGRVKFTIAGLHPHLLFLRNHLIMQGFALVDYDDDPDFVMVGGLMDWEVDYLLRKTPVLLLSDDSMYSDRDFEFNVRDKVAMREDDPIFIPSPLEPKVAGTLQYLMAENHFLTRMKKTMVLRVFDVYGPSMTDGLIHEYIQKVRADEALPVYGPGYQTRTFLHERDFLDVFDKLVERFLSGTTGIYNVGSPEETSIKRLADSVWQISHGAEDEVRIEKLRAPRAHRWWVLPDLTRTQAVAKWKPRVTLRTGLWEMLR